MATLVLEHDEVFSIISKVSELDNKPEEAVALEVVSKSTGITTDGGMEFQIPGICELYDNLTPFIAKEIQWLIDTAIDEMQKYKVSTKTRNYLENIFKVMVR